MLHPWINPQGNVIITKRKSTPDALRACAFALDPDTLLLDVGSPELNTQCWPLTDVVYSQVPKDYPVINKAAGYAALSFLSWVIFSTTVLPWSKNVMLIQAGSIPFIQTPLISALNSVTSNGQTLLMTLPIV